MYKNILLIIAALFVNSKALCEMGPEVIKVENPRKFAVFMSSNQQETFGYRVSASYEIFSPLRFHLGVGERIFPNSSSNSETIKNKSALEWLYGVTFRTRFTEAFYLLTYAQNISTSVKNAQNKFDSIESGIAWGLGANEGAFVELGLGIRYLWSKGTTIGSVAVQEPWVMFPTLSIGRLF